MVDKIYTIKNRILDFIDEVEDFGRVNANELGEFVDMVKDLAEAEKYCREASYYHSITDAMDESAKSRKEHSENSLMKSGNKSMSKDDALETLREEFRNLAPEERSAMKKRVLTTLGIR